MFLLFLAITQPLSPQHLAWDDGRQEEQSHAGACGTLRGRVSCKSQKGGPGGGERRGPGNGHAFKRVTAWRMLNEKT